jgi:hypothetical protein
MNPSLLLGSFPICRANWIGLSAAVFAKMRRRFQTMAELKIALEDLKQDSDSGALAPPAATRRSHRVLAWMAGLAVVASGFFAA